MKKCNFWKLLGGGPGPTGPNSCYGPGDFDMMMNEAKVVEDYLDFKLINTSLVTLVFAKFVWIVLNQSQFNRGRKRFLFFLSSQPEL